MRKNNALFIVLLVTIFSLSITTSAFAQAIIADHRAVMAFDKIPDAWLEKAKALTIHFGHTSHGSQIISGLEQLEKFDPKYSFARRLSAESAGLPPMENPPALRMYDGNPPKIYIGPLDYWDGTQGMNRTRDVVSTKDYDISLWSWCGQQSHNSSEKVSEYLNALDTLDRESPGTRFIYMTGHLDGGSAPLKRNNDQIRAYVRQNSKVLFDFADIESYDLAGNFYPNATDACEWCVDWCEQNPEQCDFNCACSHSHKLNCLVKAKAFWWLMARMAGWNPNGEENQAPLVDAGKDVAITWPESSISLNGSASDDGLPSSVLNTNWTLINGPKTVRFDNPGQLKTTATFEVTGVYQIQLEASDGALLSTDTMTVTVNTLPEKTLTRRVSRLKNDAEETRGGRVKLRSIDLDMTKVGTGKQVVGVRFTRLNLLRNTKIIEAYIEFEASEKSTQKTDLTISIEDIPHAAPFRKKKRHISKRKTIQQTVQWNDVEPLNEVGQKFKTPDLSGLIQKIINRVDWKPNNSIAFLIKGTGHRAAHSIDGKKSAAPALIIRYEAATK